MLFDSVAIVQQGFGGPGIEGQDITLHTAIVLVDTHGLSTSHYGETDCWIDASKLLTS